MIVPNSCVHVFLVSCRFSCKSSLLDHINRRSLDIRFYCFVCLHRLVFYNPCAFLQHVRQHFTSFGGKLDLSQVHITPLPYGMAGLFQTTTDVAVYDVNDDEIVENVSINSRFYNPVVEDKGKRYVRFQPKDLLFLSSINNNLSIPLVLKQISRNIPRCKFVTTSHLQASNRKISTTVPGDRPICPECKKGVLGTMVGHFLGKNRPWDERLECEVCKYIAPSKCSFQAHKRMHEKLSPFVCPDCGKTFESAVILRNHMSNVCYHLVKRVNFGCPVQKCRKLFTVKNIFKRHFFAHFLSVYHCKVCKTSIATEGKDDHLQQHDGNKACLQMKYECLACKKQFYFADCKKHAEEHMPKRELYVYSYVCRWCHSKFKSTSTYSIHVKRCPKRVPSEQKQEDVLLDGLTYPRKLCFAVCGSCKTRKVVAFSVSLHCQKCTKCGGKTAFLPVEEILKKENRLEAIIKCLLCNKTLHQGKLITHAKKCSFAQPVVKMSVYDRCKVDNIKKTTSEETPKKTPSQAETPAAFDGVYRCKFCDYTHTGRVEFRDHVVAHREGATSYQCMECGDCFVVKLSLIRHLMYFHKIADLTEYFKENECFGEAVVEEGLKENQCSVCLQQFGDERELSNHFRIHGMAFLKCSAK